MIASSQSAEYVIRSHVRIDGKILTTEPQKISVKFPRLLPELGYSDGMPINLDDADQLRISRKTEEIDIRPYREDKE